jgi:hypothetical protein
VDWDPAMPAGLRAAVKSAELVPGRATLVVRAWTPVVKLIQRARGNGQVKPGIQHPPAEPRDLS